MTEASWRASIIAAAVFAVRLVMRQLPGKYCCRLWNAAMLAFLLPVSLRFTVRMPQEIQELEQTIGQRTEALLEDAGRWLPEVLQTGQQAEDRGERSAERLENQAAAAEALDSRAETWKAGLRSGAAGLAEGQQQEQTRAAEGEKSAGVFGSFFAADMKNRAVLLAGVLWLLGSICVLAVQAGRYAAIKRRLQTAVRVSGRIYRTDLLASPVLFGFWRPRIYLPLDLDEETAGYAVLHEQTHLKRMDNVRKLLAFLVCVLYWWNPLAWLMYRACENDMERACDEAVLEQNKTSPARYAQSLLNAERCRSRLACGLTFSAGSTKRRVEHILCFKKAGRFRRLAGSALTAVLFAAALLSPKASELTGKEVWEEIASAYPDMPEYKVYENKNEQYDEEPGMLWVRILGEHDWDDPKKWPEFAENFHEIKQEIFQRCPDIWKLRVDWREIEHPDRYPFDKSCSIMAFEDVRPDMVEVTSGDETVRMTGEDYRAMKEEERRHEAEESPQAVWEELVAEYPDYPQHVVYENYKISYEGYEDENGFRVLILQKFYSEDSEMRQRNSTAASKLLRRCPQVGTVLIEWYEYTSEELLPYNQTQSKHGSLFCRKKDETVS